MTLREPQSHLEDEAEAITLLKRPRGTDPLDTGYHDSEDDYDNDPSGRSLSDGRRANNSSNRAWTMVVLGLLLVVCLLTLTVLLNPLMTPKGGPNPHEVQQSHEENMSGMQMGASNDHHEEHEETQPDLPHDSLGHDDGHEEGDEDRPFVLTQGKGLQDRYILDSAWDYGAKAMRREYNWTVRDKEYNPDGVYRPMILINDQFPGPLIEVNEGDTIVVHLSNEAVNATSIHWHGLYQNGTNFMDGTVGVTQCPVAPGSSFTYEFQVPNQSGTYWYHSHQSVQSSDGLFGPLIIHGRDEKKLQEVEYETDRVIMVSDHYHDTSSALLMEYLASGRENIEPVPDSALINGQNIRDCSRLAHRRCDNTTSNVAQPEFVLEAGKSHRLRFINTGAFAEFQVAIDEHDFSVTEVDGTDVHPMTYNRLTINPAQRYSVIVNMTQDPQRSYWLRAKMLSGCFGEDNDHLEAETYGVVRYFRDLENTPIDIPQSKEWSSQVPLECHDMNTTDLVPVVPMAAPPRADASFYLRSNFEIGGWALSRGFFNKSSWRPSVSSPSLLRSVFELSANDTAFMPAENVPVFINNKAFEEEKELVIQSNGITVIDLLVENFDDGNHPLHLHGYKFFVLAAGHGYPPENLAETIDLTNPLRRDTASVEAFGWVLLRVLADNPGMWAFHCHVAWHSEAGLMMQLLTRADAVADMKIPEANIALCNAPAQELEKGAGPRDEVFFGEG